MMQAIKNIIMGMGDGNCGAFVELGWWLGLMAVVVFIATVALLNLFENFWVLKRKDY